MRNDFEIAASILIEVDPFRRATRSNTRNANVSAIDFSAGRGSTGVDLHFHPHDKFLTLPKEQQDELREWLHTKEGRKSKNEYYKNKRKSKSDDETDNDNKGKRKKNDEVKGNWRSKFKKALKSDKGLKTVMSILAEEEKSNQALVAALTTTLPPKPSGPPLAKPAAPKTGVVVSSLASSFPATNIKLQSILKNK